MSGAHAYVYYRYRWPDAEVPAGEPLWFLDEVDREADNVLRSVHMYPDGRITRNSVELEQRNGDVCPSLIDVAASDAFADMRGVEEITPQEFERFWAEGEDEPFWFPR